MPTVVASAACIAAALAPATLAAQQTDIIRGRIVAPDSTPVQGATVTATSTSGNVSRRARTDRQGRFTITFPGGDGDYVIQIAALGFSPKRFQLKRVADEEVLLADARLSPASQTLDAMRVTAPRGVVSRADAANAVDVGGSEQAIANSAAQIPADQLGDLAAMAASLPGINLVPGADGTNGFSAFGLGADQNNTALNGMQMGLGGLPRDAAIMTSLLTSPYDVSRGGFSGAQFSLRTSPGSNFVTRGTTLNLDAPQLQWNDPRARALGQPYTNLSLGGRVAGPIVPDKAFYNASYQLGRRANDFQSLVNTSGAGLQTAGVAPDSAARLLALLDRARVPVTVGGVPNDRTADNGSLFGSIDLAPPSSAGGHAYTLTFNGGWNRTRPTFGRATDVPAASGRSTGWNAGVQARHSGYLKPFGVGVLSETSLGWNAQRNANEPFLTLPSGRVRVNSVFDDGSLGVASLGFGGSGSGESVTRSASLGWLNQLSWVSLDNKHRLKLTSELRRDTYAQDARPNLFGAFAYNSLADLEAGRPFSYARQLTPRASDGAQLVGGLSLGDSWRKSPDLQLQYGVRVDAHGYLDAPTPNGELDALFGRRNDRVPVRAYVSPRVGFSWTLGTAPQVLAFDGAARVPRHVLRGGMGMFQNTTQAQQLAPMLENTGLPDAVQQLVCTGVAVPVPDWSAFADDPSRVPTRCADGSAGSVFANAAPNLSLFARDWIAARSWRGNLQWTGPVLGNRFQGRVDATWSRNLAQSGTVDLNFDPTARFTLRDEGGRPVFVAPAAIAPLTGAVGARAARVSPRYNQVSELRSDLRGETRQLTVGLSPTRFSSRFGWSATYVLQDARDEVYGFASTAGDPFGIERARAGFVSRHQLQYTLSLNLWNAVRLNWFGNVNSGRPFTPTIGNDVNGDGRANDRAFVFDPAAVQATDPALAAAMRTLLDDGPPAARDCLRRQLGRVAGRNSCTGPWTSSGILSVTFDPVRFRMPYRANLSLQVTNPIGALDMALHGADNLRGWGQPAFPDEQLLFVRGFDPQAQRYRYEVNERFANTSPQRSAFRAPVTMTAMFRLDLGPTRERQMLTQQLDRGRTRPGQRLPEPMLRAMYAGGQLPNPLATILRQQDSLRLTAPQADSIAALNRWYSVRVDSIWTPVTQWLGALGDRYDHDDAYDRYLRARGATLDLLARIGPTVRGLLTAEQQRKLPPFVASHLDPRFLAAIRPGTATFAGGGGMMLGGGGGPGGGAFSFVGGGGGGGGGGPVIIMR